VLSKKISESHQQLTIKIKLKMENEIRMIHSLETTVENSLRITTLINYGYAIDVTRQAIVENLVMEKIFGKKGYSLAFKPKFYKEGNPAYSCDKVLKLNNGSLIMRYRKCSDGKCPDSEPMFIYASKKDGEKLKIAPKLKNALNEGGFERN